MGLGSLSLVWEKLSGQLRVQVPVLIGFDTGAFRVFSLASNVDFAVPPCRLPIATWSINFACRFLAIDKLDSATGKK